MADQLERCARALHRRDVVDPACEPDQREWDHLTVKLQDEYRADARAVLDAVADERVKGCEAHGRTDCEDCFVEFATQDSDPVNGGDGSGVVTRHWIGQPPIGERVVIDAPVLYRGRPGWTIEGPFVLESSTDTPGAVDAIREAYSALTSENLGPDTSEASVEAARGHLAAILATTREAVMTASERAMCTEAEDRIRELEAENDRLREVLDRLVNGKEAQSFLNAEYAQWAYELAQAAILAPEIDEEGRTDA